ncbi:DBH-like monooxygenase protein 1 homolog [Amphibalanus amphitrite]|uniref:DBH-like monooxygenase protein 1 homolog n=1 Tax=Amphibalanus amphitrite TaxID=1232801 RepID=UPI001C913A95|nr:DBH-like monooxygenase protein 1 homolog [Amphibalanus amphitrite]
MVLDAVLVALATLTVSLSAVPAQKWDSEAVLAADGSVRIQWRIHDGNFTCQLEATTLGWVGFGLSPTGAMANSDMVVAGVKDGMPYLMDMHSADSYQLIADQRQVSHLVAASENSTRTVVTFTRPLTPSCLPDAVQGENRDITMDTQRVLFAYHESDPEPLGSPQRHQHRGQRSIHLRDPAAGQPPPPPPPPGDPAAAAAQPVVWNVVQHEARLPSESTVYWCRVVRAPQLTTKHHVIKYRPLIQPGSERIVHHMLVYQCSGHDFSDLAVHADGGGGGYRCYSANMPPAARGCRGAIAGWGVGGEDFEYPPDAGYPIGPDHGAEFYILETHYDLQDRTGVVDSSGLEFTLTPQPRREDAAMLIVGHDVSQLQLIPPGQRTLPVAGHCSDECLQLALPDSGVTVFAALPHTHLLGRQIRLRHFQGNTEVLPSIVRDDNYDFNYQQLRHVPPRRVARGDQLTVECVYRSTERQNATLGGRATQEEMCVIFMLYYPAVQLAQCVSTPQKEPLLSALGVSGVRRDGRHDLVVTSPAEFNGLSLQEYANDLDWSDQRLTALSEVAWRGTHVPECYEFGRVVLETTRNTTGYPPGVEPQGWLVRDAVCPQPSRGGALLVPSVLLGVVVAVSAVLGN